VWWNSDQAREMEPVGIYVGNCGEAIADDVQVLRQDVLE